MALRMTISQFIAQFWPHMLGGMTFLSIFADALKGFKVFKATIGKAADHLFGHTQLRKDMREVNEKLQLIAFELKPNGGTSLRDVVNNIDKRQVLQDERLRALSQDALESIQEFSPTGQLVWCNRTYLHLVNRDFTEVLGFGWMNTISPKDRETVKAEFSEALKEERGYEGNYCINTGKGDCCVSVKAAVMRSQKTVLGYIAVLVPIR